ncbi:MAG: TAT-variant-translocated molybdopterin oxidoreductase [Planctomycetes bacterium]|nr:TAT-variant-translocated molybdopterin oxidoreductase [Planctomycetota bacterium]
MARAATAGGGGGGAVAEEPRHWRSLEELAETEEFRRIVAKEFPHIAPRLDTSSSRRDFLKIMGASLAMAGMSGLSGCLRWPKEKILPFTARPDGRLPGVPVQYATSMELGGVAHPILATSFDGRPIKIEGNPEHPQSQGAAGAILQGSVLGIYDPCRSRQLKRRKGAGERAELAPWAELQRFSSEVRGTRGAGVAILHGATSSLGFRAVRARLGAAMPNARWFEYEPVSADNERAGSVLAFGRPYRTRYDLAGAARILALDADFLMTHPEALRLTREYAAGRRGEDESGREKDVSRLYVIESMHSITGSVADERYPCRAQDVAKVAAAIASEVARGGGEVPAAAAEIIAQCGAAAAACPVEDYAEIAKDLLAHRGAAPVIAGARQPAAVHALAHLMNGMLENAGKCVRYAEDPDPAARAHHVESLRALVTEIKSGNVRTLFILEGNPAYDAPADISFRDALAGAQELVCVRLGLYEDETSALSTWHVPAAHYLESWGDARSFDGAINVVQPLIEPLYGGKSQVEFLSMIADEAPRSGYDITREAIGALAGGADPLRFWERVLHDGFVRESATPAIAPRLAPQDDLRESLARALARPAGLEAVFAQDYKVYDGRFANNGWLQELPDPMTKLTWDNAAIVGVGMSRSLGIETGDLLDVTVAGRTRKLPAFVLPGHSNDSITIHLGYGREGFAKVAGGATYNRKFEMDASLVHRATESVDGSTVGFDTYRLRPAESMLEAGVPAAVTKTGGKYVLATTQVHHAVHTGLRGETDRRLASLIRTQDIGSYRRHGGGGEHHGAGHHVLDSLWTEHKYDGHRWAMAIDLSTCTGCSACVVACQAENNIAVTGKDEVAYGREMHWIRIDRYFTGDEDDPRASHQPVTCHHCENAPCEQVCPVAATVHSAEGLNDMVYNRCIGTRYCSNNCPFKVRRFNYYNNYKDVSPLEAMIYNPEVSMRHRGVMEKCTFCVQRINGAKIRARNEKREIRDGEITPACAQSCPAQAIVFGDLGDPAGRLGKAHAHARAYSLLDELHLKPRTKYLVRLTNPVHPLAAAEEPKHG